MNMPKNFEKAPAQVLNQFRHSIGKYSFLLIDVLKRYDNMKEEINTLKLHKLIKTFNTLMNNVIILSEVWKKYRK